MLDDAAKLDNVPPETLISSATKLVDASERVKVTVVVSPAFNDEALDVIAMVGAVLSLPGIPGSTILPLAVPSPSH